MDVASLCMLPVGVVRWRGPGSKLTVVVKATFILQGGGWPPLARQQLGLQGDAVGTVGSADELEKPSDFAPLKARADVLVVGYARSARPQPAWPISFRVGEVEKRFSAVAGRATSSVPLLSPHLRREPWKESDTVRVAPRPLQVAGWATRSLHEGFDFGCFNVAPPDQQLEELAPGMPIGFDGLFESGRVELVVPALTPAVYVVEPSGLSAAGAPVPLRCDTLWIHTEQALLALTWRGVVDAPSDGAYLAVDATEDGPPEWSRMAERLGRARWMKAVDDRAVEVLDDEPTLVRHSADDTAPMPSYRASILGSMGPGRDSAPPGPSSRDGKTALVDGSGPAQKTLPLTSRRRETLDLDGVRGQTLPFAGAKDEAAQPIASSSPDDTASYRALEPHSDPLPFASSRPVAHKPSVPPPLESRPPAAPPPPPRETPVAPPPEAPTEAVVLLPLQIYAQIKVALILHGRPLDEVLKEHHLDAITWRLEERRRAEALSLAADRGDLGPIRELRRAMRQAQGESK